LGRFEVRRPLPHGCTKRRICKRALIREVVGVEADIDKGYGCGKLIPALPFKRRNNIAPAGAYKGSYPTASLKFIIFDSLSGISNLFTSLC
jgi:hypothetical protein